MPVWWLAIGAGVARGGVPEAIAWDGAFDAIVDDIGEARFVAIGETHHGNGALAEVRVALTQHLVAVAGVRAVAIENAWVRTEAVQQWLATCGDPDGSAAEAATALYIAWMDVSTAAFLDWACAFNADHADDPVEVFGFDTQDPGAAARIAATTGEDADEILRVCLVEHRGSVAPACRASLAPVASDPPEVALARIGLLSFAEQLTAPARSARRRTEARDRGMATLLSGFADRVAPGGRVVVWAHTAHVLADSRGLRLCARTPVGRLCRPRPWALMGTHMAAEVGDDWWSVGMSGRALERWTPSDPWVWHARRRSIERRVAGLPAYVPLNTRVSAGFGDAGGRLDRHHDGVIVVDEGRQILDTRRIVALRRGEPLLWASRDPDAVDVVARGLRLDGWASEGDDGVWIHAEGTARLTHETEDGWIRIRITPTGVDR